MRPLFNNTQSAEMVIVDLSNMAYRNAHAGADMTNSRGEPSGHIYLSVKAILALKYKYPHSELVFALDSPRNETFRVKLFPEYKGTRKKTLEYSPVFDMHTFIVGLRCTIARAPGFEADDVIASLVTKQDRYKYVIVSNDKDLWSLLSYQNVTILNPRSAVGTAALYKAFLGLPPRKIAMFKAILGDTSDNIPSVPRLRKKKVAELLAVSENLEEVFAYAEDYLSKKETEKLLAKKEQVRLNLKLATLQNKLDVEMIENPGSRSLVQQTFDRLEMTTLRTAIADLV